MKKSVSDIYSEYKKLAKKLSLIQEKCKHPKVEKKDGGTTGHYDPSCDAYWTDYHCPDCDKSWRVKT